jgi:hypothetical protein
MSNARHIDCTIEEYHAIKGSWSHSQMEVLLEDPALFHGRFITGIYPRVASKDFDLGAVAHQAILAPHGVNDVLAIIPPAVLNAKGERRGKPWQEWSEANADKIQLKRPEAEPVIRMVDAVFANEFAVQLLAAKGPVEFSIAWDDDETSLPCRMRADKIAHFDGYNVIPDVKTCRSVQPREFARTVFDYGYHRQGAWYWDGVEAYFEGVPVNAFMLIAVQKTPPYTCAVYEMAATAIEFGRKENRLLRHELKRTLETGNWTSPLSKQALTIDLPKWAYNPDEWEVER